MAKKSLNSGKNRKFLLFAGLSLIILALIWAGDVRAVACASTAKVKCSLSQNVSGSVTCTLDRQYPCANCTGSVPNAGECTISSGKTCTISGLDCQCSPFRVIISVSGGGSIDNDGVTYGNCNGAWNWCLGFGYPAYYNPYHWICVANPGTCTINIPYTPPAYALSVSKTGAGSGTITSNPAGINCGTDCSQSYNSGTSVTLTASAAAGSTFTGWSGSGCSGTGACAVSMTADRSVTANFNTIAPTTYALSVSKTGAGSGTITSNPAGINCGSTCSYSFNSGTSVSLTATAAGGFTFTGWSGSGCSGTGACAVSMTADRSVTANFNTIAGCPPTNAWCSNHGGIALTVPHNVSTWAQCLSWCNTGMNYNRPLCQYNADGPRSCWVNYAPAGGIGNCAWNTSHPPYGSFWSPPTDAWCSNHGGIALTVPHNVSTWEQCLNWCNLNMNSDRPLCQYNADGPRSCWVNYAPTGGIGNCAWNTSHPPYGALWSGFICPTSVTLTVTKAGAGSGTVTSNPAGINCGSTCSASYVNGTSVTLTAAASSGSVFSSWSGACAGASTTCTLSMTQARNVTAIFALNNRPPVADFSCVPSCMAYVNEALTLDNNSSDPDNNLVRSEWDILNWGSVPDLTCCASGCNSTTVLCNYTVQSLANGFYDSKLTVRDAFNLTSNLTKTLVIKKDAIADFVCSNDNANWQACNSIDFRPAKNTSIYFHDNLSDAILTQFGLAGRRSAPSEGAAISQRVWKKDSVTFNSGNNSNPSLEIIDIDTDISLQVTDTIGRSASISFRVTAGAPLPEWEEIIPTALKIIKERLAGLIFFWR